MTALGVWLLIVGISDIARTRLADPSSRRSLAVLSVSAVVTVLVAVGLRPSLVGSLAWAVAVAGLFCWLFGTAAATRDATGAIPPRRLPAAVIGYAGLGAGMAALVMAGQGAGELAWLAGPWSEGTNLAALPMEKVLLAAGLIAVQPATGNIAVRLLLDLVGVPPEDNEKRLKGGRVLGPLERVFIVVLGLAGQLTAASIVVAAKALLRFPEVRRSEESGQPSDVTEYFLIGSLSSWLFAVLSALLGLVLI